MSDNDTVRKAIAALDDELTGLLDMCAKNGDNVDIVMQKVKDTLKDNPHYRLLAAPRCRHCKEPMDFDKADYDFSETDVKEGVINCVVRCHRCNMPLEMETPEWMKGDGHE